MAKPKRIILLENVARPFAKQTTETIRALALKEGIKTHTLSTNGNPVGNPPDIAKDEACLIIACGGDGTIIEAAHRSRGSGIPIAGVNAGYLGFLSAFSARNKTELKAGTHRIFAGRFQVENRIAIEALGLWAINDVVLLAREKGAMVNLHVRVGGTAVTRYLGDGMIIATPTGSTAYSLAAGGPVLTQANRSLVLTPICPHSFANRSLIVSEADQLEIRIPKTNRTDVTLCCDGATRTLSRGENLEVKASADSFPLVSLSITNRYNILVEKLGWKPLP